MKIPAKIIDAHHHLWDLKECHHTWLMETGKTRFFGDPAPIQKNYHVDEFKADFAGLPVVKSVHIQVGVEEHTSTEETQWLQSCADQADYPHAIVAFCDLTNDNAQSEMDTHQSFENVRGVRQIVGRDAAEDARNGTNALLEDKWFKEGLESLVKRKLSFDLQLTPPLLSAAAKLFKSVEDVPLALCHGGSPQDHSAQGIAAWERGLRDMAEHENMICKLSGFVMFDHDWTIDSLRGKVLRAIDVFGPSRIAFGSNFPVDKLHGSYSDIMGAYMKITEGFSESERDAMFHDTAQNFYRI